MNEISFDGIFLSVLLATMSGVLMMLMIDMFDYDWDRVDTAIVAIVFLVVLVFCLYHIKI